MSIPIAIPPEASGVITALSQMGYNAKSAISDLIDNSIEAEASKIKIIYSLKENWMEIRDNGKGMKEPDICNAFIYGKRNKSKGLGKFGMGMKTATTSMGKIISVFSNTDTEGYTPTKTFTLNLDIIEKTNKWEIQQDDTPPIHLKSFKRWINTQSKEGVNITTGTSIRIENLRNLLDRKYVDKTSKHYKNAEKSFDHALMEHIGIVFHKFIEKGLEIQIKGKSVKPTEIFKEITPIWDRKYNQMGINTDTEISVNIIQTQNTTGVFYYRENRIIDFGQFKHGIKREDHIVITYEFESEADCFLETDTQKSKIERINLDSDILNEIDAAVKEEKLRIKDAAKNKNSETPNNSEIEEKSENKELTTESPSNTETESKIEEITHNKQKITDSNTDTDTIPSPNKLNPPPSEISSESSKDSELQKENTEKSVIISLDTLNKEELIKILRNIKSFHPQLIPEYE